MARLTYVSIPGQDEIRLPGNLDVPAVRTMIGSSVPGLAAMEGTVTSAPGAETTRISFSQRSGSKG